MRSAPVTTIALGDEQWFSISSYGREVWLWISVTCLLGGILWCGLLFGKARGGGSFARGRSGKRSRRDMLRMPPFPVMKWSDNDYWEGNTRLPAWAGFLSCRGAYGSIDSTAPSRGDASLSVTPGDPGQSRRPSEAQCRAFEHLLNDGDAGVAAILHQLRSYYDSLRPRWEEAFDAATMMRLMPRIEDAQGFRRLIGLHQIHIHPWQREGLSYVGLEFGCTWDPEHGFGVLLHGSRVVEIGGADTSFAWKPKEADAG